jgi:hypothetical protein
MKLGRKRSTSGFSRRTRRDSWSGESEIADQSSTSDGPSIVRRGETIQTASAETATTTMKTSVPDAAYAPARECAPELSRGSAPGRGSVGDTVKMHPVAQ